MKVSWLKIAAPAIAILAIHVESLSQDIKWVSAYYPYWREIPPSEIDFRVLTHVFDFAMGINPDGTLGYGGTPARQSELISAAHAHNKKVLISIGGAGSGPGWNGATAERTRAFFIHNIVAYVLANGYDGVDLDWEPVDNPIQWTRFVPQLRDSLKARNPKLMLTAFAVQGDQSNYSKLFSYFDQINVNSYEYAGPWPGWISWPSSPLYNGGQRFPGKFFWKKLPCVDDVIQEYLDSGIPKSKLAISTYWSAQVWKGGEGTPTGGVTSPRQSWTTPPAMVSDKPYSYMMDTWGDGQIQHYDSVTQTSYISIDNSGSADDVFISFDNELIQYKKVEYIRKKGLSGIFIWDFGGGYRPNKPAGQRDPQLQALRRAVAGEPPPLPDREKPAVSFSFPHNGSAISGVVKITVQATDNVGILNVKFQLDGNEIGRVSLLPPYGVTLNSWTIANGRHTLSVVAMDQSGNSSAAQIEITVDNRGPKPLFPEKVVYDDALKSPFMNTSWSAKATFDNPRPVKSGKYSLKVEYSSSGALDFLSGNWGAEVPISPEEFDSLKFDVYPTSQFTLTVAFYNDYLVETPLVPNCWNSISVPLRFNAPINRFYFLRNMQGETTCYFDNIRFTRN
jgi:chitinase